MKTNTLYSLSHSNVSISTFLFERSRTDALVRWICSWRASETGRFGCYEDMRISSLADSLAGDNFIVRVMDMFWLNQNSPFVLLF